MLAKSAKLSNHRLLSFALIAGIVLTMLFALMGQAKADYSPVAATPNAANRGSVFTMKLGGYNANERVSLWTTDPNSKAMDASYMYADANGNIELKVQTTDPDSLAADAGGNYTNYVTVTDDDGNITEQYLNIILFQPSSGAWFVTAQGNESSVTQVGAFSIN